MEKTYSIKNNKGMTVVYSPIGAGLVDIIVPDKFGKQESVLVHPLDIDDYNYSYCYFGKPTGRTAGRIENGEFNLNGKRYSIEKRKTNKHALHGGVEGFAFKVFSVEFKEDDMFNSLIFKYLSPDGEGGYPGELKATITYKQYKNENKLLIIHEAISDKDTLCNFTTHAYFNLAGNCKRDILDEMLYINASKYGKVDKNVLATGIFDVDENYDFMTPHSIGKYIEAKECQEYARGYDNPFVLNDTGRGSLSTFLLDKMSGRCLKIVSSYECMVLYTTCYPDEVVVNTGKPLSRYLGCCLEMQHFPNACNSNFIKDKKDILKKGEKYSEFVEYDFTIE